MDRRRFLTTLGRAGLWSAGGGMLAGAGGLVAIQPRRHRLPSREPRNAARPRISPVRKHALVVGGGVAGLVAAFELGMRNFAVTLVELAPELGGKLGGWNVNALGETFPVEHGFHGFFDQYYNFNEVLHAVGADRYFDPAPGYPVAFGDGHPEVFGRSTSVFPLNLASVVAQSRRLHFADFVHDGPGLYDLMRYDGEPTFRRFDDVDFATFLRRGRVDHGMIDVVLRPFGRTTLNRLRRLSAAEAIRFFHFYFMGNPEGLGFSMTRQNSMQAVIAPLVQRLRYLGVEIRRGLQAQKLVPNAGGGRIETVLVDNRARQSGSPIHIDQRDVAPHGWTHLERSDGVTLWLRRAGHGFRAVDGRCTHMGCTVAPDAAGGFLCPCHGGRYNADGVPIAGPPPRALQALPVQRHGDEVVVGLPPQPGPEPLRPDYCVLACEVRGLKRLVAASELPEPHFNQRVSHLGEADPYVVWRLWLDKPVRPERAPFYTVTAQTYTDSLAVYSAFQEPFRRWAKEHHGAVVEVHAYAIAPELLRPAEQIRAQMRRELDRLLPELAGARVLYDVFMQQHNFTRWAPGDHRWRPGSTTPWENLFLAGDFVRLPAPASLMEAAAMSGRLAVNGVLRREGLQEIPIWTVAPEGPLA